MQRYKILHRTYYNFTGVVTLEPHILRLRPREDHGLRIESSLLNITPTATLRWHRDVEDNSIAVASFNSPANQLLIESEVIIQQYNLEPLDFLIADYAVNYPFAYKPEDWAVLAPYVEVSGHNMNGAFSAWLASLWHSDEHLQTYGLLQRITERIQHTFSYQRREESGVQSASDTLNYGTGSCRDLANLLIVSARHLGFASRFVSGYLHAEPSNDNFGSTHAWAEVFLPGAGWTGFDPTIGNIVGTDHIAVAVARSPELVPPVEGSFNGPTGADLDVGVWVTNL
jgi:transglutaminase-like putative cysteine protease